MKVRAILYIHGFLSSPLSAKAKEVSKFAKDSGITFVAPDVNMPPKEAFNLLENKMRELLAKFERGSILICGSSLGGFYAGSLANLFDEKVLLLNPCLRPWEFVIHETGLRQVPATGQILNVKRDYAKDLFDLAQRSSPIPKIKENALAIISTNDEVLNAKESVEILKSHTKQILFSYGDNHQIERFKNFICDIAQFCKD